MKRSHAEADKREIKKETHKCTDNHTKPINYYILLEFRGKELCQCESEVFSPGAVVRVCGQHAIHATVDLQSSHTQRCAAQLIHQRMAESILHCQSLNSYTVRQQRVCQIIQPIILLCSQMCHPAYIRHISIKQSITICHTSQSSS